MGTDRKHEIRCSICGRATNFFAEPLGPFCSLRCQRVDLGRWLGEDYKISEPLTSEHFAQFEELSEHLDPDRPEEE